MNIKSDLRKLYYGMAITTGNGSNKTSSFLGKSNFPYIFSKTLSPEKERILLERAL